MLIRGCCIFHPFDILILNFRSWSWTETKSVYIDFFFPQCKFLHGFLDLRKTDPIMNLNSFQPMVKRNVEQDMVLSSKIVGVNHASKFLYFFYYIWWSLEKTGNVSSFLSFVDLSNFELTPFITNHFFHGLTYWNICTKLD